MLDIVEGKIDRPVKAVIYGSEGIGKTTFASQFPGPLFIDTEGGTAHLDVRRVRPGSWEELIRDVNEVASSPNICQTLVIDTADWAEIMCTNYVCQKYKQNSIEGFGYGKGYTYLSEEFGRLLSALDTVVDVGMNVVITAHAKMRKFEQPDEQGSYDRWEMKLSRQVAPLVKEWPDMLLFLNYKTYVVTSEDGLRKKAQGGKRTIYTTHHPCWDAKNRYGLPDEMSLDFANIAHLFNPQAKEAAKARGSLENLKSLMRDAGVSEGELRRVVAQRGQYPEDVPIDEYTTKFINGWVVRHWSRIVSMVVANRGARSTSGDVSTNAAEENEG